VTLAGAGRTEQENVGALFEPGVASSERRHLRLADHRDGLEVEGRECLADRQARFGKMALDAAAAALCHLVLGEGGEEPRRGPAFLVGLLGKLFPHHLDGGQAQFGEQQFEPRGVDRSGRLHAWPPAHRVAASGTPTAASSS
jgi:hypothetical protein